MVGYRPNDSMTPNQKLIAGCLSGVMTRFITQPLDVVKIKVQLSKKEARKRLLKTSKIMLKEEGVQAFFQGHNLGQVHSILSVSSQFYVYELSTSFLANIIREKNQLPYWNIFAGIFAGCCSATLAIPLEVIRVRQMILSAQYKGLFNGAKQVYKTGGILAFYEGLGASLLQMGPAVGTSFAVFTFMQHHILRFLEGSPEHFIRGNNHRADHLALASSISGSISGLVSKTTTYPFDLAKRRLQFGSHKEKHGYVAPSTSQNLIKCRTLTSCLMETLKREGVRGLYRGWQVTIIKAQITSIVAFTSYEMFCYGLREIKTRENW